MTITTGLKYMTIAAAFVSTACGGTSDGNGETGSDDGGATTIDAAHADGSASHADAGKHVDAGGAHDSASIPDSTSPSDASGTGGGWTNLPPKGDGVWVRVRNSCSFPLWIHGQGDSATLQPDDASLAPGESRDYTAPLQWSAARVTAYVDGPRQGELEKAELTFGGGTLNYNVTYVDWVGLPLEIAGFGGNCNAASDTTGCYAKQSQILSGCPESFLKQGKQCVSPRSYCLDPTHQSSAYCHALDGAIASCAACPGGTTPDVYACAGPYQQEARLCAALNRGMTSDPDNANDALYYTKPPFNTYSKWVHQVCPDIYAFPYDDWKGKGGFRSCSANEVRITFCPSG